MSLRGFLVLVALTDAFAWGAWGRLLITTAPDAGLPLVILFYASLALALLGLFAVIGFCIRVYIHKRDELITLYVKRTFRQGMLLSLLIVATLGLSHAQLLRWWVLLIIIGALGLWEHILTAQEHRVFKK